MERLTFYPENRCREEDAGKGSVRVGEREYLHLFDLASLFLRGVLSLLYQSIMRFVAVKIRCLYKNRKSEWRKWIPQIIDQKKFLEEADEMICFMPSNSPSS